MKTNDVDQLGRRQFLKGAGLIGTSAILTHWPAWAQHHGKPLRFGVIADVHKDIMHDADQRLTTFVNAMREADVDFVVQLGDFCVPKDANQEFLDIWNTFTGPRYHVIGNHDTDGGYQREQTVKWWGMPSRYYAFDRGGVRFIVLDGNDKPEDHAGGYPRYIAEDQLDWLRQELGGTKLPVIILSHQSLEREDQGGVQNGDEVRKILEEANAKAGRRQVIACFSGHHHRDYVRQIRDIVYPQINSASYYWVGGDYQRIRYSEEIDKAHPYIKYTVPYKDPIYAIVTIDHAQGYLRIEGKRSTFVGPAPWEIGRDRDHWDAATLKPGISDWKMPI